jgi:hypothetical protein
VHLFHANELKERKGHLEFHFQFSFLPSSPSCVTLFIFIGAFLDEVEVKFETLCSQQQQSITNIFQESVQNMFLYDWFYNVLAALGESLVMR